MQPRGEPLRAPLAKGAAMAPRLQRVEHDDPPPVLRDHIMDEAVILGNVGEMRGEMRPVVMIAHAGPDREVALAEGAGETAVAVRVTPVGQEIERAHVRTPVTNAPPVFR